MAFIYLSHHNKLFIGIEVQIQDKLTFLKKQGILLFFAVLIIRKQGILLFFAVLIIRKFTIWTKNDTSNMRGLARF